MTVIWSWTRKDSKIGVGREATDGSKANRRRALCVGKVAGGGFHAWSTCTSSSSTNLGSFPEKGCILRLGTVGALCTRQLRRGQPTARSRHSVIIIKLYIVSRYIGACGHGWRSLHTDMEPWTSSSSAPSTEDSSRARESNFRCQPCIDATAIKHR